MIAMHGVAILSFCKLRSVEVVCAHLFVRAGLGGRGLLLPPRARADNVDTWVAGAPLRSLCC